MKGQLRRAIPVALAAAVLLVVGGTTASAGGAEKQSTTVHEFASGDTAGHAWLNRTDSGLTLRLSTDVSGELTEFGTLLGVDWERGDATTVWLVVFNAPENCVGGCGEDEVLAAFLGGSNEAEVGLHFGNGHVAGGERFRTAATLQEGDTSGRLFGMPLKDAMAAEVHTIVRSHGPAATLSGKELSAALHSVDGGCGTNICGDAQFAVFPVP